VPAFGPGGGVTASLVWSCLPRLVLPLAAAGASGNLKRPVEATASIESDFLTPDFAGALDPEPYLAVMPPDETCKGLYFTGVIDVVRRLAPGRDIDLFEGMQNRRFIAFRDYLLREHMVLTLNAVRLLYPRIPSREGMRRLGWLAFPSMVDSMIGRVVFGVLGRNPDSVMAAGPRAVDLSIKSGRATARKVGNNHFRYAFWNIYGFLDTYYVGVVEGALKAQGVVPRVRIAMSALTDAEMDVMWI
jgi:uncharacterized protein (TIGR02265 family)